MIKQIANIFVKIRILKVNITPILNKKLNSFVTLKENANYIPNTERTI